jgi:hypothetical protein
MPIGKEETGLDRGDAAWLPPFVLYSTMIGSIRKYFSDNRTAVRSR